MSPLDVLTVEINHFHFQRSISFVRDTFVFYFERIDIMVVSVPATRVHSFSIISFYSFLSRFVDFLCTISVSFISFSSHFQNLFSLCRIC